MSRCTEHQFVTQTSERQTNRTHNHAADKPLSTQLNSVMDCAAPTSVLRCSSTGGLQQLYYHRLLPRAALPFATAGAWKMHGYSPCLSNSSARSCKYVRLKLCYLAALYATAENNLKFVWCVGVPNLNFDRVKMGNKDTQLWKQKTQIKVEMTVIWGVMPLCYKTPNVLKNQLLLHICSLVVSYHHHNNNNHHHNRQYLSITFTYRYHSIHKTFLE